MTTVSLAQLITDQQFSMKEAQPTQKYTGNSVVFLEWVGIHRNPWHTVPVLFDTFSNFSKPFSNAWVHEICVPNTVNYCGPAVFNEGSVAHTKATGDSIIFLEWVGNPWHTVRVLFDTFRNFSKPFSNVWVHVLVQHFTDSYLTYLTGFSSDSTKI